MSSSLKQLDQFSPDFTLGFLLKGYYQFVQKVLHHKTRCLPCPCMVKKKYLKIYFSRTKKTSRLNRGIQHRGLKVYQVDSNDDSRLTFNFLWQGQICIPILLYGENVVKSFSENVLKTVD